MQRDGDHFWTAGPSTSTHVIDPNPSCSDRPQFNSTSNASTTTMTPDESNHKRRKPDRACDWCRKRKTKCDGSSKPNNVCSNCTQNRNPCTYVEGSKPRGPPKAYITSLEDRLERMEALLKRLRPEEDFTERLGPPILRDAWKYDPLWSGSRHKRISATSQPISQQTHSGQSHTSPQLSTHTFPRSTGSHRSPDKALADDDPSSEDFGSSDNEECAELSLTQGTKRLTLQGLEPVANSIDAQDVREERDTQMRFHGKSSSFYLIGPTRELRKRHMDAWHGYNAPSPENPPLRRQYFWNSLPWERAWEGIDLDSPALFRSVIEYFPPPDLANKLIDLYFYNSNTMYPILHRQIFDKQWADGLQRRDAMFAAVCLALFAVGSRWCDDPRVIGRSFELDPRLMSASTNDKQPRWALAGWGYIIAVLDLFRHRRSVLYPACLFELQLHCLLSTYLRFQTPSGISWCFGSIGIRKAQDVGIHRKKLYYKRPTAEDELWKRSLWVLVGSDRMAATALGRSCSSREEDMDVDLPVEVDDDYWLSDTPGTAFKQPSGKPSTTTAFNLWIKLTQIAAFAVRTLYAVDKTKVAPLGLGGPKWKQQTVKQLNAAMDDWVESVPEHLKWSARIGDHVFANQSATLFVTYYIVQLLIYRPFLPSPQPHDPQPDAPFPAVAICVNATKACLKILETQLAAGMTDIPVAISASQLSAALLVQQIWRLKAQAQQVEAPQDVKPVPGQTIPELLSDVKKFIDILEASSVRWPLAALMVKHLKASLPADPENAGNKRPHSDVNHMSEPAGHLDFHPSNPSEPLAALVDKNFKNRDSPSYTFASSFTNNIATARHISTTDFTPRFNEDPREQDPQHQRQHLLHHPTTYNELPLTGLPKEARPYTMPTSWARTTPPEQFQPPHLQYRDPIVKRELPDDYDSIRQIPSIRKSTFAPSLSQEHLQMPNMETDWHIQGRRSRAWMVQANANTAYADWT